MTIRELQELLKFMDEKSGSVAATGIVADKEDICRRFCEVVREANAEDMDLTESLAVWFARKKH